MPSPATDTTARLADLVAAAIRARIPIAAEAVDDRTVSTLEALSAELDRGGATGQSAEAIVARFIPALPRSVGEVLATAASGGDGIGALAALEARASGAAGAGWRFGVDLVYPLVICALAAAGVAWLTWWYGPLVAAVDDTLTGPRAGVVFDSRPVTDVIGWPGLVWGGLSLLALATTLGAAWRGLRSRPGDGGRLAALVAGWADPAARETVAHHERLLEAHRRQVWGKVPAAVGSVVAGGAVLIYGMALFRPLVTMMQRVAEQPAVAVWRSAEPETGR